MNPVRKRELPFVLFKVAGGLYAVSSAFVREITQISQVTCIPQTAPEIRGVITLRGKVIKLVDLRLKLGLRPLRAELDELVQLLKDREQDHRNWLTELEACVREHRPFKLARDPHKCKFGLWYDEFKTQDRLLGMTLPAMDVPHKAIHAAADLVLSRAEAGDINGAIALIEARRNLELSGLIRLFEESRKVLVAEQHELAMVLSRGQQVVAVTADEVDSVERIPEENLEDMPVALSGLNSDLRCRVAKRVKSGQTILLPSDDFLFSPGAMN